MAKHFRRADRALSPVIEKTLVTGIALMYIGGVMGLLIGGVVPTYETAAGEELSERTLATAAGEIEQASTGMAGNVTSTTSVTLPPAIDDTGYELRLDDERLVLEHPTDEFDRETTVAFGENVTGGSGTWNSGGELVIHVEGTAAERTVTIGDEP